MMILNGASGAERYYIVQINNFRTSIQTIMKDNCKRCLKHRNELNETPWGTKLEDGTWGIICKPCREIEINEKIQAFQESEQETDFEDNVICPYCGGVNEANGESEVFYNEGYHEYDCGDCGNKFEVETMISYYYTTRK